MSWSEMPIFAADVLVVEFFAAAKKKPVTAGSKRGFVVTDRKTGQPIRKGGRFIVNIVDDTGDAGKEWRKVLKAESREAFGNRRKPVTCAVEVEALFVYPRPLEHFRADGSLKPWAPKHHETKPDATKLWRAVEDALTGVVWADDGQVVRQVVRKRWSRSREEKAGVYVQVVAL